MLAPLIFFAFESPPEEFAVYGLASDWWSGTPPPVVTVTQQGCPTCKLVRQFVGGVEVARFKRTRTRLKVTPYCPTCYTYPPAKGR